MENIGIRLALLADFSKAAKDAASNLDLISESLQSVKNAGSRFNVSALNEMQAALIGVAKAGGEASAKVSGLNTSLGNLQTKSSETAKGVADLALSLGGVVASGTEAAKVVVDVASGMGKVEASSVKAGKAAKTATSEIANGASNACKAVDDLVVEMSGVAVAALRVNAAGVAFTRLEGEALAAMQAVRELDNAIRRLPTSKTVTLAIETRGNPNWSNVTPAAPGVLPRNAQYALPGGYSSQYGPIPQPASRSRATGVLTGEQQYALPGGTDPDFNYRVWEANQRANGYNTPGGGGPPGPPIVMGPNGPGGGDPWWSGGGDSVINGGRRVMRFGNDMQGAGQAGVVNSMMLAGAGIPVLSHAMDLLDLQNMAMEPLAHAGTSDQNSTSFIKGLRSSFAQTGGDFRSNLAGINQFVSGTSGAINYNDPGQQAAAADAYHKIVQLAISDSSSIHPVDTGAMALNTIATAKNFGFKMDSAESVKAGVEFATNFLVGMRNKTSSSAEQAAMAMRAIGPIMSTQGMNPEDIASILGVLAENKILGAQAGNQTKRIFTRQATDPKALAKLQEFVSDKTKGQYNLSEYNKDGSAKSPVQFLQEIGMFEKKFLDPKDAKSRSFINATAGGLYAIPGLSALTQFYSQFNTPEEAKAYGHNLLNAPATGQLPGQSRLDRTVQIRQAQNPRSDIQKTQAVFDDQTMNDVKNIQPAIKSMLDLVSQLVVGWGKLPDPVRAGLMQIAMWATAATAVVGVSGMLLGNFVKLAGAFGVVGGGAFKLAEHLLGMPGLGLKVAEMFRGILPKALGIASIALRGLIGILVGNPIGIAVTALVIAGTILYEAWTHDWGGIREVTANTIKRIKQSFDDFLSFWRDLGTSGTKYIKMFVDGIVHGVDVGKDAIKGALKKIGDLFPHSEPADQSSPLAGQTASGQAHASMFIDGAVLEYIAGATKIKKATKPIADVFIDLKGQAVGNVKQMGQAIEAELKAVGAVVRDRWMTLYDSKTKTSTRVFGDPAAFQDAIRAGKGGKDTHAADAVRQYKFDMDNTLASDLPNQEDRIIHNLRYFEKGAGSAAIATIEHLVADVRKATDKAKAMNDASFRKLADSFLGKDGDGQREGYEGRINTQLRDLSGEDSNFTNVQSRYSEHLQNQVAMQKHPTADKAELNAQLQTEITERRELENILTKEEATRDALTTRINEMQVAVSKITGTDQADVDLKARLNADLLQYQMVVDNLNVHLETQGTVIAGLTTKIDAYKSSILNAKAALSGWALIVADAMTNASKAAADALGKGMGDVVDKMTEKLLGATNKKQNIFDQAIGAYVKAYAQTIVSSVMDEIIKPGSNQGGVGNILKDLSGANGSGFLSMFTGKKSSSTIATGSPTGTLSNPAAVTLVPQTGSTDVGQGILDATSALQKVVTAPTSSSSPDYTSVAGSQGQSADDFTNAALKAMTGSNGQKTISTALKDAAGVAAVASGVFQGGGTALGAIEAAGGAESLFSGGAAALGGAGPYVAAAAAIFSILHTQSSPAQTPDLSQSGYGQFVTDIQGQPGTFGVNVAQPSQAYSTSAGNLSLSQQLEQYLSAPNSSAGLNSVQLAEFDQLKALQGNNPNGLGIKGEYQGNFTLESGQTIGVTDYENLVSEITSMMSTFQNNVLTAQQNANALATSFTSLMIGGPAGFTMPKGGYGTVAPGGGGSINNGLPGSRSPQSSDVTINILPNANVASASAQDISDAVLAVTPQITDAVNRANYNQSRLLGQYTSKTF